MYKTVSNARNSCHPPPHVDIVSSQDCLDMTDKINYREIGKR